MVLGKDSGIGGVHETTLDRVAIMITREVVAVLSGQRLAELDAVFGRRVLVVLGTDLWEERAVRLAIGAANIVSAGAGEFAVALRLAFGDTGLSGSAGHGVGADVLAVAGRKQGADAETFRFVRVNLVFARASVQHQRAIVPALLGRDRRARVRVELAV